jgi:hypothetical protein
MGSHQPAGEVLERERMGVRRVLDKLVRQFPQVPATTVHSIVDDAHEHLTGRIRDFVPIFVERRSREKLRSMVQGSYAA